jgi:hypothetical protein
MTAACRGTVTRTSQSRNNSYWYYPRPPVVNLAGTDQPALESSDTLADMGEPEPSTEAPAPPGLHQAETIDMAFTRLRSGQFFSVRFTCLLNEEHMALHLAILWYVGTLDALQFIRQRTATAHSQEAAGIRASGDSSGYHVYAPPDCEDEEEADGASTIPQPPASATSREGPSAAEVSHDTL